jgi:uncharacterized protein
VLALTACWLALTTAAVPPAPTRWVTDEAQVLSPAVKATLDARLQKYEQQTGHQVIVYLARTTGEIPIEDWAEEAFKKWGVGRAGVDDGAVLFVFTEDRAARIEVGYGLEGLLPDAIASRIIRELLGPKMAAGEVEYGITQSVEAMLQVIGSEGGKGQAPAAERRPPTPVELGLMVIAVIVFGLLMWRHPALAFYLLSVLLRGGRGGGGGNGGFGGGGGRSGGGGASGRW